MANEQAQHALICQIKDLALELQRFPKRSEAEDRIPDFRRLIRHFYRDNFSVLLKACGFEVEEKKRITNSVFEVSIEKHLESYEPEKFKPVKPYPTIASISDIHWPFSNEYVIKRFLEYVGDEKPEWVIINGDAWDMYSHTKFPRSHNIFTPREERAKSREMNTKFWQDVKRRHPEAKCEQMLGNHDIRPLKRVLEEYPEAEDWIAEALKRDFTFEGTHTTFDQRQEFWIDKIMIVHGYRSKLGDHRDYALHSAICGHTHMGGVVWKKLRGELIFELNSGLAGDPLAKGLSYTPQKLTIWTPGFGAVNKYGPAFIPA